MRKLICASPERIANWYSAYRGVTLSSHINAAAAVPALFDRRNVGTQELNVMASIRVIIEAP